MKFLLSPYTVPPPIVSLIRTPNTSQVYSDSRLRVTCIIEVHPTADETPTDFTWSLIDTNGFMNSRTLTPSTSDTNTRVRTETNGTHFSITAEMSSLTSVYTGPSVTYSCSASVRPTSSPFVVASRSVSVRDTITIGEFVQ